MTAAYWVLAGPLALFYLYAGGLKTARSRERLRPMMAWVDSTPMPVVRAIGAAEVLGAVGLVLPPATGIAPAAALPAAVGFVLLQLAATGVHLRGGDRRIALNLTLLATAAAAVTLAAAVWR
ncbi:DoxX family protein [Kitasatospora misakiensis]|uniref:DoxX family protein n=1 Tax=Kitasatospora misakiensis TaxID=67330 RepID=A0ABW0X1H3_9ACTN